VEHLPRAGQKMRNMRKRRVVITRKMLQNQRGTGGGGCPWKDARAAIEREAEQDQPDYHGCKATAVERGDIGAGIHHHASRSLGP